MAKISNKFYITPIECEKPKAPARRTPSSSSSSKTAPMRLLPTHSTEMAITKKMVTKGPAGGLSVRFDEKHKAGAFIDQKTGRHGVKAEASYKSSVKVNDMLTGCSHQYQTHVTVKKITTFPNSVKKTVKGSSAQMPKKKTITYHY